MLLCLQPHRSYNPWTVGRTPNELHRPVLGQVYAYVLTPLTHNRDGSGKRFDKTNLLCGASKKEEHHRTTPVLWQQKKNTTAPQTVYKLLCLSQ